MSRTRPTVIAAVVSLLLLALLASAAGFLLTLAGVQALPALVASGSPVLFPFSRTLNPLAFGLMVAQLVVLAIVTALVTALSARGADPRRGFWPVLFGVWLAAAVAGYLAAPVSLPYLLGGYRYEGQLLAQQVLSIAGRGGGWGLYYGWIGGLVAGLVHRVSNARTAAHAPARAVPGRA